MTKYILKTISYIIIIFVVAFAMMMVGVKCFGIQIYTVLSGSMEPVYKVGSLIYVVDTNVNELKEEDVITFKITDKVVATHRIKKIVTEENEIKFQTKGDANDFEDEVLVTKKQIVGEPIFTIPYMGYVATFMQTTSGRIFSCIVFACLMIIVTIIDHITDKKKK